jgi:MobA/VirD2-like, nuclease domain
MNIKGESRAGAGKLAKHLLNAEKNEKITIVAVNGTVATDLHGAFSEMEAVASGTRCKKPLYHAKISPDPKEPRLTPAQWDRAVQSLAEELGMEGHAYTFVLHQKYGDRTPDVLREHGHVVFCRINPDTMLAAHDGHNYRKHEVVARQLESEFGHARIQGAHVGRDGQPRPERTPPDWSMQQAARTGIQPESVADTVKRLHDATPSAETFAAALPKEGLTLAVGTRDLVVLDADGGVHTLRRCLNLRAAQLREWAGAIDRSKLPTVEQAREAIRERNAEPERAAPAVPAMPAPARGTLPAAHREEQRLANDNQPPRPEIMALAALLHKQKGEPPELSANDNAAKERMLAYGFDAAKPEALAKWRELGERVDAGRITEKDRIREMAQYLWLEADKERRAGHVPGERERQQDRER